MTRPSFEVRRAFAIVLATVMIASLRVMGWKSPTYQAIAHLWTGFLFGGWYGILDKSAIFDLGLLGLALALCVLEVACFLLGV